jgi:beta-N-acetylhexosaminidase
MSRFGATILGTDGLRLSTEERAFFQDVNPFGFILFARNVESADQVRALCGDLRDALGRECPITIDQEGGRVQRLRSPTWREWLPPLDFVKAAGDNAERAMYLRHRIIADELRAIGVDSNCAPMVDVADEQTHDFLRNRCYGTDANTVTTLGRAAADGLLDGGVLPVVKHIPGHGRATADSHFDLPKVDAPRTSLDAHDFAPFKALNDLPLGMTAHLVYNAIDETPATLSTPVMDVIRNDIGFDGLIMTDDISMKALSGDLNTLSKAALKAGCDVILHCNGTLAERRQVAEASGEMTEIAQTRALRALEMRKTPDSIDISAYDAELEALLAGGA